MSAYFTIAFYEFPGESAKIRIITTMWGYDKKQIGEEGEEHKFQEEQQQQQQHFDQDQKLYSSLTNIIFELAVVR